MNTVRFHDPVQLKTDYTMNYSNDFKENMCLIFKKEKKSNKKKSKIIYLFIYLFIYYLILFFIFSFFFSSSNLIGIRSWEIKTSDTLTHLCQM